MIGTIAVTRTTQLSPFLKCGCGGAVWPAPSARILNYNAKNLMKTALLNRGVARRLAGECSCPRSRHSCRGRVIKAVPPNQARGEAREDAADQRKNPGLYAGLQVGLGSGRSLIPMHDGISTGMDTGRRTVKHFPCMRQGTHSGSNPQPAEAAATRGLDNPVDSATVSYALERGTGRRSSGALRKPEVLAPAGGWPQV